MISEPSLDVPRRDDVLETHLDDVVRAISTGRLTIFLGAGANACCRPDGMTWQAAQTDHLPLGNELADHLATKFKYPFTGREDLARVSQWVELEKGIGDLYDQLESLFKRKYPPTILHRFLASLPRLLHPKGYPRVKELRRYLLVTANYDDLLEQAFAEAGQPVHVVTYQWEGQEETRGRFFHRLPGSSELHRVDSPNDYEGLQDESPIILKIHGALDREGGSRPNVVITEDHYLNYVNSAPEKLVSFFPNPLPTLLLNSSFLFLGYALKDWNLRIILQRIWRERTVKRVSWSIQVGVDPYYALFWKKKSDVKILEWPLADYIAALRGRVEALPPILGDTSA